MTEATASAGESVMTRRATSTGSTVRAASSRLHHARAAAGQHREAGAGKLRAAGLRAFEEALKLGGGRSCALL